MSSFHSDARATEPQPPIPSNRYSDSRPPAASRRIESYSKVFEDDEGEEDQQSRHLHDAVGLENNGEEGEGDWQTHHLQDTAELQIDEASPSEDERLAERFLHGGKRCNSLITQLLTIL